MSTHLLTKSVAGIFPERLLPRVLVFKTSIDTETDVETISQVLNPVLGRDAWNVDLDDIDKVLRIETEHRPVRDIIDLITRQGYICQELPD
jgi:hypothetical protein